MSELVPEINCETKTSGPKSQGTHVIRARNVHIRLGRTAGGDPNLGDPERERYPVVHAALGAVLPLLAGGRYLLVQLLNVLIHLCHAGQVVLETVEVFLQLVF